ncbi:MAG: hypothetical protein AB7H77_10070 [Bdellovibrionales bacterium]
MTRIIHHRRNRIEPLRNLPKGSWIEIDIDLCEGMPFVSHDPVVHADKPMRLEEFLPQALVLGIGGFIFDCKREGAAATVQPLIDRHNITDYFYLNEMEIQADMSLAKDSRHRSALRIWQYRSAADVIRYAAAATPGWAWIDSWQRGLEQDIGKAFIPLSGEEARRLKQDGVKLCLCSPELYAHTYDRIYAPEELEALQGGVIAWRDKVRQSGIQADAVCTKFAEVWG